MKGDDLRFANKLSLVQRHAESAQLNLDTLNELIREMVGGFERMQKILTTEELRAQMTAANGGNGRSHVEPFVPRRDTPALLEAAAEDELEPLPVKQKKKLTKAALKQLRLSAAHARQVRLDRLNGHSEPAKTTTKTTAKTGLKPVDGKDQKEFNGYFPYPYFVMDFMRKHPAKKEFTPEDIIEHAATLGYLAERRKVSQSLTHQSSVGTVVNVNAVDGQGGGSGRFGLYKAGKLPILGRQYGATK